MTILVTGGAGYIGSHTCVQLIEAGYDVVIVDNFANSHPESLHRIEKITGRAPRREAGDIRDRIFLEQVIRQNKCTAVIHFAASRRLVNRLRSPYFIMTAMSWVPYACCRLWKQLVSRHWCSVRRQRYTAIRKGYRLSKTTCNQSLWSYQAGHRRHAARSLQ